VVKGRIFEKFGRHMRRHHVEPDYLEMSTQEKL